MPEIDFIQTQLRQEDRRTLAEKVRECAVLGAVLAVVSALFLYGLAIEKSVYLVAYLVFAGLLFFGWQRYEALDSWFKGLLRRNRTFAGVFLAVLLFSYPLIFIRDAYLIHLGALAGIFVIAALGLNITLGLAGLLDVGFAAYFAAGAYTSAQLAVHFGVSFWGGVVLGGLVAAFLGFCIAWPALRVQGHYLAMVTLGYGLIMNILHRNLRFLTNGTDGIINIPPPSLAGHDFVSPLSLFGLQFPFQANFYYLTLAFAGIVVLVSLRLQNSKIGRCWEAIREDEIAAKCFGVNLTHMKIVAFSTGAFFGGVAGAIFAHMIGFVHPDNFILLTSITILAMVLIGGMGNIFGVAIGAVLLIMIPERLREFANLRLLLFGAAMALIMIYRPQGLFPNLRRRRELEAEKVDRLIAESGKDHPSMRRSGTPA
jgi:branched-chain amino acid transport system permease protein